MNNDRHYSNIDKFCFNVDQAVRTIFGRTRTTHRLRPDLQDAEPALTLAQRKHCAALMRVNHAGEVCAQALYHGQSIVSRRLEIQQQMQHAAIEEGDHLAWCNQRVLELGSHVSYFNPLWYIGSLTIGIVAGLVGDQYSLGFVAETESQVVEHLQSHILQLPLADSKSYKILQQMQYDEEQHRNGAIQAGAALLPAVVKKLMRLAAKLMVKTAYWI